jgi:hypothetical protein
MAHESARTPEFARPVATLAFSLIIGSGVVPVAAFAAEVSVVHLNASDTKSGDTPSMCAGNNEALNRTIAQSTENQSSTLSGTPVQEVTIVDINFDPVLPESAKSLPPNQQIDEKLKIFDAKRREIDEKARLNYLSRLKQDKARYDIEQHRLKLREQRAALDERRASLDERRVALDKERWDLDAQSRKIDAELLPLDKQRTELDELNRKLDESRVTLELARSKVEQRQRELAEKK